MPVMRCMKNGKPGWKWGQSGTCYTGPGAKGKAEAQGRAAYAAGYGKDKKKTGGKGRAKKT